MPLSTKPLSDALIGWQGATPETRARLLEGFCTGIRTGTLVSNSVGALVVGAFILAEAGNTLYFVWLLVALLGGLMPRMYASYLRRAHAFHEGPECKALVFIAISLVYGLLWGIGPLLVLPGLSGASVGVFLILVIFGTIMGPYAAMPGILYVRLIATGVPTLVAIALYTTPKITLVSVILCAWLILRTDVWRGYHRVLRREIELRESLEVQQKELERANLAKQQMNEDLKILAETDPLTGAANRRQFLRGFESLAGPAAVVLFDIDHFKTINDRLGHYAGDIVLAALVGLVKGMLRNEDLLARLGGDEFAVLLPDVSADEAGAVAERVRETVEHLDMDVKGEQLRFTVSLGVATIPAGVVSVDADAFLHRADTLLYAAKHQGRNRICADVAVAGESPREA